MQIRPWRPGDESAILDLFEVTFGYRLSEQFWRWRFLDHPAGDPMVMLAWDGDRLAAHYAACHSPLLVDGQMVPAALSMTTMTHPDYRGQRLFERVASALYEDISSQGVQAIWGFPNINSTIPFRRRLGWTSIADVAAMHLRTRPDGGPESNDVQIVPEIDERFDRVPSVSPDGIRGLRNQALLHWRVDLNPVVTYTRLVVADGDGLAGYAVIKEYRDDDVDILDLDAADEQVLRLLVSAVSQYAYSLGRENIYMWCLPRDDIRLWVERAGFVATGPVTYLGGRNLGTLPEFDDPRRWRVSMLDSDVY